MTRTNFPQLACILAVAFAVVVFSNSNSAEAQFETPDWLKNLDPTNRNSAVREGFRDIDPTNRNSELRKGLRNVDPTNRNSPLRRQFREHDPWEASKLSAYHQFRDRYLARIRGWQPEYLRPGNIHYDMLVAARHPNGTPIFDPNTIANTEFYFNANINGSGNEGGLTLGNKVLIGLPNERTPRLTALIAHELAHVIQVQRMGESAFGKKYVSQTIKNGIPAFIMTGSESKAHAALPLEQEAHSYEHAWENWHANEVRMAEARTRQQSQTQIPQRHAVARQPIPQQQQSRVNVQNPTAGTIVFNINYQGRWEQFSLLPGQSRWFASPNSVYSLRYDSDNTAGVNMRTYTLRPNSTNNFTPNGNSLELYAK